MKNENFGYYENENIIMTTYPVLRIHLCSRFLALRRLKLFT